MSEIICKSISNGREFGVPNDYFRSLHALRSECNSYTSSEARYTELLEEHDKQVRTKVIEEFVKAIEKHQTKQDSYLEPPYVEMGLDMTDVLEVVEQLKENNNENSITNCL